MTVPPAIPFAVSGAVLVWAVASAALAFTGGVRAGLHETAPEPKAKPEA
jgi:hypothetical protein